MASVHTDVEHQRPQDHCQVSTASSDRHSDGQSEPPSSSVRSSSEPPDFPSDYSKTHGRSTSRSGKGRARYSPYPASPRGNRLGRIKLSDLVDRLGTDLPLALLTTSGPTSDAPGVTDHLSDDAITRMIRMQRSALNARILECSTLYSKITEKEQQLAFLKSIVETQENTVNVTEKTLGELEAVAHQHGIDVEPRIQAMVNTDRHKWHRAMKLEATSLSDSSDESDENSDIYGPIGELREDFLAAINGKALARERAGTPARV
ncbi:hypothetical protein DAEQUDRAFT_764155 [Daedalea quercina L-15889]|uniref:Uncharacterized protein n=1 Tax=Daedalea quercina L-15889 TaxID=1314783 RepID=A0A165RL90_9APHY|nr:hypothetical protein DAEQUDRAFT_764155 [Daedalea quercina L-15889]